MNSDGYPPIIYKYRNFSSLNHKAVLTNKELWFASPLSLNDPDDCRIEIDFRSLNTLERAQAYADKIVINNFNSLSIKGRVQQELIRIPQEILLDPDGFHKRMTKLYFDNHNLRMGVLSMCKRWDNRFVWHEYGDNGKGVAYGFLEECLRNSGKIGGGRVDFLFQELEAN